MSDIPPGFRPVLSDNYREALFAQVQRIEDSARRLREEASGAHVTEARALCSDMAQPQEAQHVGADLLFCCRTMEREAGFMEADARTLRGLLQIV